MHNYRSGIEEALNSTKFQLDKIHTDIGRTLEKIRSIFIFNIEPSIEVIFRQLHFSHLIKLFRQGSVQQKVAFFKTKKC